MKKLPAERGVRERGPAGDASGRGAVTTAGAREDEPGRAGFEGARSFVGHESFSLRFPWLKKCVDAVSTRSDFFSLDDATTELGVGRNMVKSIRHWGLSAGVIEADPRAPGKTGALRVSALGRALFSDEGADPFLEDPSTLWLIHWQLCASPDRCTTWRWVFGAWNRAHFSRDELHASLARIAAGTRASEGTLSRDAEVFLRTYLPPRVTRTAPLEDALDSPLLELRLLREDPADHGISRARGPQRSLRDDAFGFAVLSFWERVAPMQESFPADTLAYGVGSPGRVLCLDDRALIDRLERAEIWSRGALLYDATAGVRQLLRRRRVEPVEWLVSALGETKGRAA